MKRFFTWLLIAVLALIFGAMLYLHYGIAPEIDADMNAVREHSPYPVSDAAQELHDSLIIVDLHADTFLWQRDPIKRHDYGHVDLPRLADGNVKLQVFSAVTKSPRGLNFDRNDGTGADDITKLAMGQFWPARTWGSIYERAAFQAQRVQRLERKGYLTIARDKQSFAAAMESDGLVTVLLTEGSHPLEGKLENIDRLYAEGYRAMGLQHFFDNELGGSMHGISKGGLTEFGREAVAKMEEMDIIIDVAHSSEAVVRDVLAMTDAPLMISHGGIISACPSTSNRNLPDVVLIEMAERGSLIGIGYFSGVICDISPDGIADTLIYAVNMLGEDNVALGSDFDGTVVTALDTSELAAITDALLRKGMEPRVIRKVMGQNAVDFFAENLPD